MGTTVAEHSCSVGNLLPLLIGLYSMPPAEITIKEFLHAEFRSHARKVVQDKT